MNTKNKSLPIGTSLLTTEHPTLQAKGRLFFCKGCREFKKHYSKGLCGRCYREKYYQDNSGKIKAASKKWQKENPEKVKAARRKRELENPEKAKIASKKWGKENPEKAKAGYKKWCLENREKRRASSIKWNKKNPTKRRELKIKRRGCGVIEKGVVARIITENIFKYGVIACEKCGEKCPDNYHIDHIIPLSKGGSNGYDNLQILCSHCNCSKHVDIADYRGSGKNKQMFLKI